MEINITELALSDASRILSTFRGSKALVMDKVNKVACISIPGVLIIQAIEMDIATNTDRSKFITRPGVKIATHDDVYELADIDYGSIKIL